MLSPERLRQIRERKVGEYIVGVDSKIGKVQTPASSPTPGLTSPPWITQEIGNVN